eukprot:CAMPEP_0179125328 /NCGR_PEP_ID=MMETSP0796-20121207/59265_1 /TAXON_ID=73915 /ORGANISM="Pyrodinium bahamense, Strain pbaha01" /LENGTH=104 /DNA_ID=CAMNT_0020824019 /DNA_START=116 /DNA_END=431 /DNA_ORIENTATION=-
MSSLHLAAEGTTLCEPREPACGLAQHHVAIPAEHNRLRVAVHGSDLQQPGHFTSMKKLFGDWIMRLSLCLAFSSFGSGFNKSMSMDAGSYLLARNGWNALSQHN